MSNEIKVSVIIPVYNIEKYLNRCVESVYNQTFSNLEIILVNDGSSDGSASLCEEHQKLENRVKVIHQKNAGSAVARNAGLEIADGKYVYFLDGDDWIKEDAIEGLVRSAETHLCDVVIFDSCYMVDESGNIIGDDFTRKNRYSPMLGHEMFCEMWNNKEYFQSACLIFIRKELLTDKKILFPAGMMHYDDSLFKFILFMNAGIVVYLPEKLYYRRIREGSITQNPIVLKNVECCCYFIGIVNEHAKQTSEIYLRRTIKFYAYYLYELSIMMAESLDIRERDVLDMLFRIIDLGNEIGVGKYDDSCDIESYPHERVLSRKYHLLRGKITGSNSNV